MQKAILDTSEIIREMNILRTASDGHALQMDTYCEFPGQPVMVCIHPSAYFSEYHAHDFYEINYVVSGDCMNLVDDIAISMKKGDFILMHPGTFHTLYAAGDCCVYNFMFRTGWFEDKCKRLFVEDTAFYRFAEVSSSDNFYRYVFCPNHSDKMIGQLADQLIDVCVSGTAHWPLLIEAYASQFICTAAARMCHSYTSENNVNASEAVSNMLLFMSRHPNAVSLDKLSERFGYSKPHICRLFKNELGKSVCQKLTDIKIRNAKVLLSETQQPIAQVALTAGFESVEYFHRKFKQVTGYTPGEYRKHKIANPL